jgi:hypothetical protein
LRLNDRGRTKPGRPTHEHLRVAKPRPGGTLRRAQRITTGRADRSITGSTEADSGSQNSYASERTGEKITSVTQTEKWRSKSTRQPSDRRQKPGASNELVTGTPGAENQREKPSRCTSANGIHIQRWTEAMAVNAHPRLRILRSSGNQRRTTKTELHSARKIQQHNQIFH